MEKRTKIFEGDTVLNCLKQLLKEGYRPATIQETWKARTEKKIPNKWYDTGTIFKVGEFKFRKATLKELKNIEKMYEKGWRLAFLGYYYDGNYLYGNVNLYISGRFFGV